MGGRVPSACLNLQGPSPGIAASPLASVLKRVMVKYYLVPAAGKATTIAIRRQLRLSSETASSQEGLSLDPASSIVNRLNVLDVSK